MSDNEEWIIEQAVRNGIPLPDKIANAPELLPGLEMYLTAFNRLSTCRQIGMGLGPIPWTSIGVYADQEELDEYHRDELYYFIEKLDCAFLEWSAKQSEKKQKE